MSDKKKFEIIVSSDLEYEGMVTYLKFGNSHVAILNCDNGINNTEIEILDPNKGNAIWKFDFHSFLEALNLAKETLKKENEIN